jgi:hypothetical protein
MNVVPQIADALNWEEQKWAKDDRRLVAGWLLRVDGRDLSNCVRGDEDDEGIEGLQTNR